MFERLKAAADRQANRLLVRVIRHLSEKPAPPGVTVSALPDGVGLAGKKLKARLIDDPALRNFGK
jgi:hypothetical protein